MNAGHLLRRLQHLQMQVLQTVAELGEPTCRKPVQPQLSPAGWHLGHCVYMEARGLHIVVPGRPAPARKIYELYDSRAASREGRGQRLPPLNQLLEWAGDKQQEHRRLLELISGDKQQRLLRRHYLLQLLIQHNAQHYETLCIIRAQLNKPLADTRPCGKPERRHYSPSAERSTELLPAGDYQIGSAAEHAPYDNEHAAHRVSLGAMRIARRPVSNAEYLDFINAGAYREADYWSPEGWQWRQQQCVDMPGYWSFSATAGWQQYTVEGVRNLNLREAVSGLSHHEAAAYANWAGARLPHEYEWEAARRSKLLEQCGRVWEWCSNTLHPYPGFVPYPYRNYSMPYFDGRHYVLRGGSRYTCRELRRASFRNYYTAGTRHLFTGLRLVFPLR